MCVSSYIWLRFWRNTGAVAGVFAAVGLAALAILVFVIVFLRRRRRRLQAEHDTAVSATLAAAGFNRSPLDDDDDPRAHGSSPNTMTQRSTLGSIPSGRLSGTLDHHSAHGHEAFNPYQNYGVASAVGRPDGYMPARTSSPPLGAMHSPHPSETMANHSASGSYDPLLQSFHHSSGDSGNGPSRSPSPPPAPPPRSPFRGANPPIFPQSPASADERLNPTLTQRLKDDEEISTDRIDDSEDYSRPVLGVSNIFIHYLRCN